METLGAPYLYTRAEIATPASASGVYDEELEVTTEAGVPVVHTGTGTARTSTLTNVVREAPDDDPGRAPSHLAGSSRTQTFTKAGGEPPDADRPPYPGGDPANPTSPGRGRYDEERDLSVDRDGAPLVLGKRRLLRTQTSTRVRGEQADPD